MAVQAIAETDAPTAQDAVMSVTSMLDSLTDVELRVFTGNGVDFASDLAASPSLVRGYEPVIRYPQLCCFHRVSS